MAARAAMSGRGLRNGWQDPAGVFLAVSGLLGALGFPALTFASNDEGQSVWISPGFVSRHFERDRGYREDNVGVGIELDLTRESFVQAGSFINSDRARTRYLGAAWEPIELMGLQAGLFAGAFDGYPATRDGRWFLAAMPIISYRGNRLGGNITLIPKIGPVHGAVAAQILLRVW
jgi:hypothetical protein